jgi:hypothetical protein
MPQAEGVSLRLVLVTPPCYAAKSSATASELLTPERPFVLPLAARSASMPYYRLYHFDQADRIERFDDFLAPHDEAAKAFSLAKLAGHSLELWQQSRKITRFNPDAAEIHRLGKAEG